MSKLLNIFTTIVALGLMWLTVRGAHSLTGHAAMTLVLSSLVVIQWAAASQALDTMRRDKARTALSRLARASPFAMLWLAAASVSVSFVGAELFSVFSARDRAETQFDAARTSLVQRASLLHQAALQLETTVAQISTHARGMAQREEREGGSCAIGRGPGPGEIRSFRRQDTEAAQALHANVRLSLTSTSELLQSTRSLRNEGDAPVLRRALAQTTADLNLLQQASLWEQARAFADDRKRAGAAIPLREGSFVCDDPAREQMLGELQRTAERVQKLAALREPQLLDPLNARDIALSTLVRTWAVPLGWLPQSMLKGGLVDARLGEKYGLEQARAILGPDSLPLQIAWLLEVMMIVLIVLGRSGDGSQPPQATAWRKLAAWGATRLANQGGWKGEFASALLAASSPEIKARPPYIDEGLFPDPTMQQRARQVLRWYRPWGRRDLIVVPLCEPAAIAARELWRLGLLDHRATGLATEQLVADDRLSRVMSTMAEALPSTTWAVYEVADAQFARWLFAQQVPSTAAALRAVT